MKQALTLNLEKDELLARADELEVPLPGQPSEKPVSPCDRPVALTATEQLGLSADNTRIFLDAGQRERQRLAQSLRNAAKAYEDVDEEGAAALDTGNGSMSPMAAGLADGDLDRVTLTDTPVVAQSQDENGVDYTEVKQAALEIETGDQGASFDRFANEWTAHQRTLLQAASRFRPFQHWDGAATASVEDALDAHRSWLYQMADVCGTMARQAQDITSVHRRAALEHPKFADLENWENEYKIVNEQFRAGAPGFSEAHLRLNRWYWTAQEKSEEVGAEYDKKAPIPPVNPPKAPAAIRIAEPGPSPNPDPQPEPQPDWSVDQFPNVPTGGMPIGGMPTGVDGATLPDASAGAPSQPKGWGVKPASFGGGGIGRGLPPITPNLGDWTFPSAPTSPTAAGPGRGIPGAGAMGAGAGMGMAPAGPGGQPQGGGKGKRAQEADDALYTEERPWTEGVIGLLGSKTKTATPKGTSG
jgi:hypothetical protein